LVDKSISRSFIFNCVRAPPVHVFFFQFLLYFYINLLVIFYFSQNFFFPPMVWKGQSADHLMKYISAIISFSHCPGFTVII
jgi:hypothetical protein